LLLDGAATYLQVLGRPAEARPLMERALAITRAAHGPGHPTVAIMEGNLAVIASETARPGSRPS
jgi:Tetratricopeptide repeat